MFQNNFYNDFGLLNRSKVDFYTQLIHFKRLAKTHQKDRKLRNLKNVWSTLGSAW